MSPTYAPADQSNRDKDARRDHEDEPLLWLADTSVPSSGAQSVLVAEPAC